MALCARGRRKRHDAAATEREGRTIGLVVVVVVAVVAVVVVVAAVVVIVIAIVIAIVIVVVIAIITARPRLLGARPVSSHTVAA